MTISSVPRPFAYLVLRQASLLVEPVILLVIRQVKFERIGLMIAIHSPANELSGLEHLESHQAVEMSEGRLFGQLCHSLRARETCMHLIIEKLLEAFSGRPDLRQ
ncbi:Uncharacterised protein [uncultured archaeon]|nr:Uncharacterised protein [uncultured archaeon]